MCKVLHVEIYCTNGDHGQLPLGKDKSELSQDEADILKSVRVRKCSAAIPCEEGKDCLGNPELRETAERHENVVCMRWRRGFCWDCIWKWAAPFQIRDKKIIREHYRQITGQTCPAFGEPLDPRVVGEYSDIVWRQQVEDFEFTFEDLSGAANSRADLREILHKLSIRDHGLSDVFTIAGGCVTRHDTGEKRVFDEAMVVILDEPRLD